MRSSMPVTAAASVSWRISPISFSSAPACPTGLIRSKSGTILKSRRGSSKYVFPFFENYTQLLLCNAADRFGAQAFVLSDVERLRELDAESGNNNMLQTLWQYSRCFNTPTAAAKALYVDRSTLHYRLKKISELMETDRRSRRRSGCVRSIAFPTARISKIKYAARRPHDRSRRRGSCGLPASGAGARVRRSSRGWSWSCSR